MTEAQVADFEALLEHLRRTRGFDFNAYKRPSLLRRVDKRMQTVGIEHYSDYIDHLEVHPEEFDHLFNTILINVTAFFRDDLAWDYLRDDILPGIIAGHDSIRVWSAGCASGEEAYSLAMLLAEAMGREAFRERVKIYATDVDEAALNQARAATYDEKHIAAVPPPLVERYFVREGNRFAFDKELRRSVIFGRHDLIQDAPISRVHVLVCRNALMYFNTEAQSRILARFHFALAPSGVLFLGKAEMLLTRSQLFTPIDLRRRMFRKVSKDNWRDRLTGFSHAGPDEALDNDDTVRACAAAFDASALAQIAVDTNGRLSLFNEAGRSLFGLGPSDLGRPLQDLELSYRPVELRSLIEQVLAEGRPTVVRDVPWPSPTREPRFFDVHIAPLADTAGRSLGAGVSFLDTSRQQELQGQLDRARQDLETAYEELQSTNEELETTNEELQSTVEELETTNEELQSTNEELETVNAELQSTNEELQTINQDQRLRTDQVDRANAFMHSVLAGVRNAVIVVDRELHIMAWNSGAEELWGVRSDEVKGQNFLNLDIGLPTEQLRGSIRSALQGDRDVKEVTVDAINRRGRRIQCRVTTTPLMATSKDPFGAILAMEETVPAD